MRSFTKGWVLPAVILATGCLAAGCGSAAQEAAGNLASKAPSAPAPTSADAVPPVGSATAPTGETSTGPSIPTATRTPTARTTVTATATVTASAAPAAPATSPAATGTDSGSTPIWPWILLGVAVLAALTGWIVHASRRRSATAADWQSRLIDAYAKGSALHDAMGVAEVPGQFAAPDARAR